MRLLREIQRGREEFYELFIKFANFNTTLILTSLCFSIRTVVNSGKICVLNLQPSSLPSIHESDLKPYVVIIIIVHGLITIMCFVLIGVSQPGLSSGVQAARRQAGSSVQGEDEN